MTGICAGHSRVEKIEPSIPDLIKASLIMPSLRSVIAGKSILSVLFDPIEKTIFRFLYFFACLTGSPSFPQKEMIVTDEASNSILLLKIVFVKMIRLPSIFRKVKMEIAISARHQSENRMLTVAIRSHTQRTKKSVRLSSTTAVVTHAAMSPMARRYGI